MKKMFFALVAVVIVATQVHGQRREFSMYHIPEYYYQEYVLDSLLLDDLLGVDGISIFRNVYHSYDVVANRYIGSASECQRFPGMAIVDGVYFDYFAEAIKVHFRTPVNVRGLTLCMDRLSPWLMHISSTDSLEMEICDTNMNVVAAGFTYTDDTANLDVMYLHPGDSYRHFEYAGIFFKVDFDSVITLKGDYWLVARQSVENDGEKTVGVPSIMELVDNNGWWYPREGYLMDSNYYLPEKESMFLGGQQYTYIYVDTINPMGNNSIVSVECTDDNEWHRKITNAPYHGMWFFFPLLTTDCVPPQGFEMEEIDGNHVRLMWEPGYYDRRWEVSYGPAGTPPGAGTLRETTIPNTLMLSLERGQPYVAYVRALCTVEDSVWSPWSDSIPVMLEPEVGVEPVEDMPPRLQVSPNPAAGEVTVDFGTPLTGEATLELYASDGRQVLARRVAAGAASLRLATKQLPSGVYRVRLAAPSAEAVATLVVAH